MRRLIHIAPNRPLAEELAVALGQEGILVELSTDTQSYFGAGMDTDIWLLDDSVLEDPEKRQIIEGLLGPLKDYR